jgi:deoxycytidine triphosphate deaminase
LLFGFHIRKLLKEAGFMVIQLKDYPRHGIEITPKHEPDSKERIVYDLHVGLSYRRPGDANRRVIRKVITLRPNDCVRIDTEEELRIPLGVFGQTCSRASLTAEGLVVANLKIDPNFQGSLNVTAFNTSKRSISISPGKPFCSIFFFTLESPLEAGAPARVPPDPKILMGGQYKEAFLRAVPHVITWGLSVAASLVAAYIFRSLR